jgi:hypothetical protein
LVQACVFDSPVGRANGSMCVWLRVSYAANDRATWSNVHYMLTFLILHCQVLPPYCHNTV